MYEFFFYPFNEGKYSCGPSRRVLAKSFKEACIILDMGNLENGHCISKDLTTYGALRKGQRFECFTPIGENPDASHFGLYPSF